MSKTFHDGSRRVRVKGVRRSHPQLRKLARAMIDLAQAEAEAAAQVEHAELSARPVNAKPGKDSE
jgi:hypothetical protein